ncbi:MAG TPA: TIGR00730 family Rossman fold protein [Plasticicumulans sp.]|nr:TIGR00730 family Rossman fold protein [Plasticicumulans sp.]HNE02739.1 TIGR00730 family Rossman fold protein [Plasticicumulans sp.]
MQRIAVYCGSASGSDPRFAEAATAFGALLAARGLELVFGGGHVGLMGRVADAVLAGGGRAIGVMPDLLAEREIAHRGLTELQIVPDLQQRKRRMLELADACIALPGGIGTFDEWFEALTLGCLELHDRPCALLNLHGYHDPLLALLDHAVAQGFMRPQQRAAVLVDDDGARLLDACAARRATQACNDDPIGQDAEQRTKKTRSYRQGEGGDRVIGGSDI